MRPWLALGACAALAAQGALQQPPSFRSGIDIVRLDVSVLDKDRRPVRGLTAADFVVTMDGTSQPIVAFDAVVMPPREVPTAPWMRDVAPDLKTNALGEPRLFVIIMDDAQTPLDLYMANNARAIARGIVDNLLADGRAHRLKIRVNREGTTVFPSDRVLLSKKPPTGKAATEPPPPLLRTMAEMVPKSDVRLGVTVAPFAFPRGFDLKALTSGVLATLRITRPAPAERETEQVQLLAKVFTPEGREVGTIRQNAAVTLRPAGNDAEFDVLTPLGLRPGRYNLRFSAHSIRLGKTGSVYTDVIVPDFEKEKISLSGVVLSSEPAPFAAPKDAFAAIIPVVPTTKREFQRTDRATAFVRIYESGKQPASRVEVIARVTDGNGAQVHAKTDVLAAEGFGKTKSTDYTCELPLMTLRPGPYLLTIEVRLGSITTRRDLRFSVR